MIRLGLTLSLPLLVLAATPAIAQTATPPASSAAPAPSAPSVAPSSTPSLRLIHLEDAVQIARKHQPAIVQAMALTEAAYGRADQARSGLLPQVTGNAIYQRVYGSLPRNIAVAGAAGSTTGQYNVFSFGVNGSQLIWDFGVTPQHWRAAQRAAEGQHASERTTELQVTLNVRRAYFQARAQRALIKVAGETIANQLKHLGQIEGFVRVGTRPEIDLAQARSDLANARVQLINAQNGYDVAKAQLNQAMGVVEGLDFDVAEDEIGPVEGEDADAQRLVDRGISNRPEMAVLELQRESQELTVKSFKGAYGPALTAGGGGSYAGNALDSLAPAWNVGLTLTWALYQGGLTNGQVREAKANVDATRAQIELLKQQVRFDVLQAALTVRGAKATIVAANEALVNSRALLKLAEGRYEAGVGSVIELGDAQVAVTNASAQAVQADFTLATARAQLLAALGRS